MPSENEPGPGLQPTQPTQPSQLPGAHPAQERADDPKAHPGHGQERADEPRGDPATRPGNYPGRNPAERAGPDSVQPMGRDPGPRAAFDPGQRTVSPVTVGPQPGESAKADQVMIMLIGGPRYGYQERVPYGTREVNTVVDGQTHTYALGANLPADFVQRIPPPQYPTQYFGYTGPDQEYVDALRGQYPAETPADGIVRGPEHGPAYDPNFQNRPAKTLTAEDFPS